MNEEKFDVNKLFNTENFDYKKITHLEFDGIDHKDYPDYCDAYISRGVYDDEEMTEEQIEFLNDDRDFVYERLMDYIY